MLKKNGFPQIIIGSRPYKTKFMSWDINLGAMNPFPLLELNFKFLLFSKTVFFDRFQGGASYFSFSGCVTLNLGKNPNSECST